MRSHVSEQANSPLRFSVRTVARRLFLLGILAFLFLLRGTLSAEIQEWVLADPVLEHRTTSALLRYYSIVEPDSIQVRYVRRYAGRIPYHLRAVRSENDTLGQLLSITLGQLKLFSTNALRVACGEDLHTSLLLSRNDPRSESRSVFAGDSFGHNDWVNGQLGIASLDRIDIGISQDLRAFAALGAPESNLYFWTDGTARFGLTTPEWEMAVLVPVGFGSTGAGPYRSRLLAPGFGVAANVHFENMIGRMRFTGLSEATLEAPQAATDLFVHTFSTQLLYRFQVASPFGIVGFDAGGGYEQFTSVRSNANDDPISNGTIRRLSPVVDISLITPDHNWKASLGVADIALRGSLAARINRNLWVEFRAVSTDIFRTPQPFEHPFQLFLTPTIKF